MKDGGKKQIPLRLSESLWKELTDWAEDDFRSLNGQIEYLLNECVKRRKNSSKDKGSRRDTENTKHSTEGDVNE